MKIIIDCRKIFDSGIGTYIYNTMPSIVEKLLNIPKLSLSLLINNDDYDRLNHIFPSGIDFIRTNYKNFSIYEQIYLHSLLDNQTFFWATSLNHPIFIKKNLLITTVYDLIPIAFKNRKYYERIIFYLLYRNISLKSKIILFISFFTKNQFIDYFNYKGQSAVTYLGVDSDWFVSIDEKEDYLISYCNLKPHKNIHALIKAYNSICHKYDSKLLLILNTDVRDLDSKTIDLIKNNPSILIKKNLDKNSLIYYVSHAKCLIVPSYYEGFGLTVLEGMASRCPVLASNVTAIPEIGKDSIFYFNPYLDNDLVMKLDHFLSNESHYNHFRDKGQQRALNFNWEDCIKSTYSAINPCLFN